ncbi:MAG: lamin tail domain-containing protein [Verrucomicrobiota bacterium]
MSYTNLASAGVATATFTGPVSIPSGSLLLGTNILAVEVHQFTTNALGADVVFGTELVVTSFLSAAQQQRESPESWLELYNRSTNAVSLNGWEFDGGIDFKFATNQLIAPGGYLVLAKDTSYLLSLYPGLNVVGPFDKSLSGSSDHLVLKDPVGNVADEVRYYAGGRWPELANGGGSSLELRDPHSDNAQPEAWAASDESGKTSWNTYTYRGIATAEPAASPTLWKEFVLGLLDAGEMLLDDISVIESPSSAPVQLIQSGSFESGLSTWRVIGNHKGTIIVDPTNPGNHVLRLVATGATGHLHNHIETTLANGAQVVNGREYEISFRAKLVAGNNDLLTRLYFNRLPRVTSVAIPTLNGTPGTQNSRYLANVGPTYSSFRHTPVVPQANETVSVFVTAADLDGVSSVTLFSSANGGPWNQTSMTLQPNGEWRGTVAGAAAGTVVQFYVEGADGPGARSTFPAAGPASRALYKVNDGAAIADSLHNIRIVMTAADAAILHAPTNVMSDDLLGGTVIYNEQEVFYDVGVHLQGSERGRNDGGRVGFTISFNPDHLFRGVHDLISIDRSGGYSGRGGRHDEILIKHAVNHAGGLPGMYDDLVHVIAPRAQDNSTGLLIMAKYNKIFLDSQYKNGNEGSEHKLELIYYPTTTADGTPQGNKLPNPDDVLGTEFRDLGDSKESYRWNFLKENQEARDDFSGVILLAKTLGLTGGALDAASRRNMDVNEWMRAFAFESLFGIADTYGFGLEHNLIVYVPPEDRRAVAFLWDMDFGFVLPTNGGLYGGGNISKVISIPANLRLYYSHLYDLITRTVNTGYMSRWSTHYASLLGQNWSGVLDYIGQRSAYVLGQLPTATAFAITSNGGNDFAVSNNLVTLTGTAPIQLETITVNGIPYPITWTSTTTWTLNLPVGTGTNLLALQGFDRYSGVLSNLNDTIRVVNSASVPPANGFVVINEIMYHSPTNNASFVEIYNAHPTVAFDLSSWRLDGVDLIFAPGTILLANSFLVVASETNTFAHTYPIAPLPIGQYHGTLQNGGETLRLLRPISTNSYEVIDEVRYDDALPWPTSADGFGPSLQLIDPAQDNTRVANWAAAPPTPGAVNSVRATLLAFPPIWINELLVFNTNGIRDNFNQREPWIELFNAGTNSVSLQGFFLTDNLTSLTQWAFPAASAISTGEFRVVWADGDSAQTAGTNYHTSFRLTQSSGSLALVRTNSGRTEVLDYVHFPTLTADRSFGSVPDGQSLNQEIFYFTTPGGPNNPSAPPLPVVINEWMADNAGPSGFRDPADGLFQDWFELYNPDTNAFDLSGHFLTDTLSQPAKWQIPPNTFIGAHGFLLVLADNQTNQNGLGTSGDLHANFQLSAIGEAIGLFAPDGRRISSVVFGAQMQNVSQGLYPDGNTNLVYFMPNWTPRSANQVNAPSAAVIGDVSVSANGTISFQIPGAPYRVYRVDFKDVLDAPAWTPLSTNRSDNGVITISEGTTNRFQRFYRVVLLQ